MSHAWKTHYITLHTVWQPCGRDCRGLCRLVDPRHALRGPVAVSGTTLVGIDEAASAHLVLTCLFNDTPFKSATYERGGGTVTLRLRLVMRIALVLIASLMLGSVAVYWHAVRKVDTEMRAALTVGKHTVHNVVDEDGSTDPQRRLRTLVADFDDDRHLRASWVDRDGAVVAASHPAVASDRAPEWFYRGLVGSPGRARVDLPAPLTRYGAVLLETDSHNEIDEVWSDTLLSLAILAAFCGCVLGVVFFTLEYALRPLGEMSAAFVRIGSGDYSARVAESGPQELKRLCGGFNQMAGRLADIDLENRRLEDQLAAVQEEERAELARDLHDEVGPLLFAVSADIAVIQSHEAVRSCAETVGRLEAVREAVGLMQRHVRAILGRLRPPILLDLGLVPAIDAMVAFWRKRYPAVRFDVRIPSEGFGARLDQPIYRMVQEGVSNALRHSRPTRIEIAAGRQNDGTMTVEVSDDGGGMPDPARALGFGLTGMRERVRSLGGTLTVGNRSSGQGVILLAQFPSENLTEPAKPNVSQEMILG
jgi:two-component system, NarL family, sensor histidine kinase UhpB